MILYVSISIGTTAHTLIYFSHGHSGSLYKLVKLFFKTCINQVHLTHLTQVMRYAIMKALISM